MSSFISKINQFILDYFRQQSKLKVILHGIGATVVYQLLVIGSRHIVQMIQRKKYAASILKFHNQRSAHVQQFLQQYENSVNEQKQQLILDLSASELLNKLNNLEITSEEIVITYLLRTVKEAIILDYICDIDCFKAIEEAKIKDEERRKAYNVRSLTDKSNNSDNKVLPILHGLPIAIKDHLPVTGYICTMGLASRLNYRAKRDCELVNTLRKNGAIFYVMTHCGQMGTLYTAESGPWGQAKNPWDHSRTTGGSSGGSGGLVALKGASIAIGSDIAGSIRYPASWNGIYGFKPTNSRVSKKGTMDIDPESDCNIERELPVSLGPLTRSVDDIILCCKSLFGQFETDPLRNGQPWLESNFIDAVQKRQSGYLNIGFVNSDKRYNFAPMNINVLNEVAKALTKKGHNLIKFDFDKFWEIDMLSRSILFGKDLASEMVDNLKGEKALRWNTTLILLGKFPIFIKRIMSLIMKWTNNEWLSRQLLTRLLSYTEAINLIKKLDQEMYKFYEYWRQLQLDVLILPNAFYFIPKHGDDQFLNLPSHLIVTNTLQMPVGTVPIRLSREDEQFYVDKTHDIMSGQIAKTVVNSKNLPVSINVAALPYEDEKCISVMKLLEEMYNFRVPDFSKGKQ